MIIISLKSKTDFPEINILEFFYKSWNTESGIIKALHPLPDLQKIEISVDDA